MSGPARHPRRRPGFSAAAAVPLAVLLLIGSVAAEEFDVRIGLVAFEDYQSRLDHWRELLTSATRGSDPAIRFHVATGTYGEVLHWLEAGSIDLAMLTPGGFAHCLAGPARAEPLADYLLSVRGPAATSAWATAARRQAGWHDSYHAVCAVRSDSKLKNAADLRKAAVAGDVRFLFVHPMSASGRLAPLKALEGLGVAPQREQLVYTYSHSNALRLLAAGDDRRELVAFVWDDALRQVPELEGQLRRLDFPSLDRIKIPGDVVVVRRGFEHAGPVRRLLVNALAAGGDGEFVVDTDGTAGYLRIADLSDEFDSGLLPHNASMVTLDEIVQDLEQHARSQATPPRLALVMSGGGAKCSYQVGAVSAIEEALSRVPVALGVTRNPDGREAFKETWLDLDQRDIVRPSWAVRLNLGVWFSLLQLGTVLLIVRRFTGDSARQFDRTAWTLAILGVLELVLGIWRHLPWSMLGHNHLLHHAWLWSGFGFRASAGSLIVGALASLVLHRWFKKRQRALPVDYPIVKRTIIGGLLVLPLGQVLTIFMWQPTFSGGDGIEAALDKHMPRLINRHLDQLSERPLERRGLSASQRLGSIGTQLIGRRLFARDLVLTGTCLWQTDRTLPSDLYFYVPGRSLEGPPPDFGPRGIPLSESPRLLFDVVMGSGSIFPVFPSRRLEDFPEPGRHIELIDGGFAHNSPIETAVLWGATHILLIQASPPEPRDEQGNLAHNVGATINHLFKQAQLLDARSRGRVAIYTLAPQPPHICVLDFADVLLADSIERGYNEARGRLSVGGSSVSGVPRFRKEPGEPTFGWMIPPATP